jgi:hypothetical protein
MPLGQGFLNAWVKVNSKHVVIPNKNDKEVKDGVTTDHAGKGGNARRSGRTASVKTAQTTATTEDEQSQVIRRFNNRKNRRRLYRTVSATDLIRDKAVKGDKKLLESEAALDKSGSSKSATASGKGKKEAKQLYVQQHSVPLSKIPPRRPQHEESSLGTEGSLRFVAGFFGADLESLGGNSKGSKFDLESVHTCPNTQRDTASVVSRSGHSLSALPSPTKKANNRGGGIGIRFPPNLFAIDNSGRDECQQCSKFQDELVSAREDLEYLRGVALRNEYTCVSCQRDPTELIDNTSTQPESISASQALNKVVSGHEAQIEDLKRERVSVTKEFRRCVSCCSC